MAISGFIGARLLTAQHGYTAIRLGPLAQLVEQGTLNPKVAGSIPARPTFVCREEIGGARSKVRQFAQPAGVFLATPHVRRTNIDDAERPFAEEIERLRL